MASRTANGQLVQSIDRNGQNLLGFLKLHSKASFGEPKLHFTLHTKLHFSKPNEGVNGFILVFSQHHFKWTKAPTRVKKNHMSKCCCLISRQPSLLSSATHLPGRVKSLEGIGLERILL